MANQEETATARKAQEAVLRDQEHREAQLIQQAERTADAARSASAVAARRDPDPLVRYATDRLEDAAEKAGEAGRKGAEELSRIKNELGAAANHYREVRQAEPHRRYTGEIVHVTESRVYQAQRENPSVLVSHEKRALSGQIQRQGEAEISYPHGRAGLVRDASARQVGEGDRQLDRSDRSAEMERGR